MAAGVDLGAAGLVHRLGHGVAVGRSQVLPLDGEHPVPLQVPERPVVGDDVEAVAGPLQRPARADAGGWCAPPT